MEVCSGYDLASVDLLLAKPKKPSLIDGGEILWRAKDSAMASSRVPWVPMFAECAGQDDDEPCPPPTGTDPGAASPKVRVQLAVIRGQKKGGSGRKTAAGVTSENVTLAARRRAGPGPVSSPFDDGGESLGKASPKVWFTDQVGSSGVGSMLEGGAGEDARRRRPSSETPLTLRELEDKDVSPQRNIGQDHNDDDVTVFGRRGGRDLVRGGGVSQTVKGRTMPVPTSRQSDGHHIDEILDSANPQATSPPSGNTPNLANESRIESWAGSPSSMTHTSWRSSLGSTASTVCADESPNAGHSSKAKPLEGLDELLDRLVGGCQEPDEVVNFFHPQNVSSILSLRSGHSLPPLSFVNIDPLVSDPAKSSGNAEEGRMEGRKSGDKVHPTGLHLHVITQADDDVQEDVSSIYDSIYESMAAAQARRIMAGKGPREGDGVEGEEVGGHVHREEMVL